MSKVANIVFALRLIQTGLGIVFLVFWIWACIVGYVVGGGVGNYVFGYISALLSLAISTHGIWLFIKKQHLKPHGALYHNARWAIDLVIVGLWLGVILIEVLVTVSVKDSKRQLGGGGTDENGQFPSATDPILVVAMGVNITELFEGITFFMTGLLLVIPAVQARKGNTTATESDMGPETEPEPRKPVTQPDEVQGSSSQAPRELTV